MRAFVHADQSGEDCARRVVQSVFVEQIAGGGWHLVDLQRALIDDLGVLHRGNAQHVTPPAFSTEPAYGLVANDPPAEVCIERERARVAADARVVEMQSQR